MTEENLTEEYLSKFPTILQTALNENPQYKTRFLKKVHLEYEDIKVFRAIHRADEIHDDDFLCNIEEAKIYRNHMYRRRSLELYAISVNEDPYSIIKSLSIPNAERPALAIAEGLMQKKYGPSDYSKEKVHHNWYLYNDAIPLMKDKFKLCKIIEVPDEKLIIEQNNTTYSEVERR